ncbi:MAG TPA: hypothetical protein VFZ21_24890, partial [Gemmatimonadaceae bacterium]|nr:hypothetical protein [Gemmatimonadaceae bacterium]
MRSIRAMRVTIVATALVTATVALTHAETEAPWSAADREMLASLSLASLKPLPADPSNRVADDTAAARLGHRLFFDTRLSAT